MLIFARVTHILLMQTISKAFNHARMSQHTHSLDNDFDISLSAIKHYDRTYCSFYLWRTQLLSVSTCLQTHPIVWKITGCTWYNLLHVDIISNEDRSGIYQGLKLIMMHDAHWSINLTQRSRLFICVDTNSLLRLGSSIAAADLSVSSWQSVSGKSMSVMHDHFCFKWWNGVVLTFQVHICPRRMLSIHNLGKIYVLESAFSILLGLVPLISIIFHV